MMIHQLFILDHKSHNMTNKILKLFFDNINSVINYNNEVLTLEYNNNTIKIHHTIYNMVNPKYDLTITIDDEGYKLTSITRIDLYDDLCRLFSTVNCLEARKRMAEKEKNIDGLFKKINSIIETK